ncbi:hypothetical protein L665_01652 [Ralstonia solanacearum SD54]|nr:hypothetical protein L665_01652 [Ralstonia solanacearum SD54]
MRLAPDPPTPSGPPAPSPSAASGAPCLDARPSMAAYTGYVVAPAPTPRRACLGKASGVIPIVVPAGASPHGKHVGAGKNGSIKKPGLGPSGKTMSRYIPSTIRHPSAMLPVPARARNGGRK